MAPVAITMFKTRESRRQLERKNKDISRRGELRKKSGELVRSSLRVGSSVPKTLASSKVVKFDTKLEHIRHFFRDDTPQLANAEPSLLSDAGFDWEMQLMNFSKKLEGQKDMAVYLREVFLSPHQDQGTSLVGIVNVANLAYDKHVVVRFTFDSWKSFSETIAIYSHGNRSQDEDTLTFKIRIDNQASIKTRDVLFCIRYVVNGQELWDNNGSKNYHVKLKRRKETVFPDTGIDGDSTCMPMCTYRETRYYPHDNCADYGDRVLGSLRGRVLRPLTEFGRRYSFESAFSKLAIG